MGRQALAEWVAADAYGRTPDDVLTADCCITVDDHGHPRVALSVAAMVVLTLQEQGDIDAAIDILRQIQTLNAAEDIVNGDAEPEE